MVFIVRESTPKQFFICFYIIEKAYVYKKLRFAEPIAYTQRDRGKAKV